MSIPEYYAGQSIFVTGGTGLMGKVLIEKILRSCPDVKTIYLLIRPKKGLEIEERWAKLTQLPLFEKLRAERPEALKKVFLVPGNIHEEDMGLSEEHKKMLQENVTMIYHVAALIQFSDSITAALTKNARGTLVMLELAKTIKNLKVFVYISTAYSNSDKPCAEVTEKVHPCCQDWKVMMKLLNTEPNALSVLREKLLCGHPNTYTWSKAIAEQMVNEYQQYYPVIIIRPGVVAATDKEPFPGWNDGTNACFSLSLLIGLGVLRILKSPKDANQDFIPVDTAIKAFLITPWKLHITGPQTTAEVYTCTTASEGRIKYKDMEKCVPRFLSDLPSKDIIWPPFFFFVPNSFLHSILFFFIQLVPGAMLDLILLLCRKKPMFTELNKNIINGYRVGHQLMKQSIVFPNQRFMGLNKWMKEEDLKDFGITISPLTTTDEKNDFLLKQAIGFFKYYMKEDMCEENLKKNRARYERIKRVHSVVSGIAGFVFAWYLMCGILWFILLVSDLISPIFCKDDFLTTIHID